MDPKGLSIDEHFAIAIENCAGPIPICVRRFDEALLIPLNQLDHIEHFRSAKMFVSAQTALRTAALVCKSGTVAQSFPLIRNAIECVVYGYAFHRDQSFYSAWKERELSEKHREKLQKEHSFRSKVRLTKVEDAKLPSVILNLYDHLISFGAHPNVFSIDGNIRFDFPTSDDGDGVAHVAIFSNGEERHTSFLAIALAYDVTLKLFRAIWPNRYFILGVEAAHRDARHEAAQYAKGF